MFETRSLHLNKKTVYFKDHSWTEHKVCSVERITVTSVIPLSNTFHLPQLLAVQSETLMLQVNHLPASYSNQTHQRHQFHFRVDLPVQLMEEVVLDSPVSESEWACLFYCRMLSEVSNIHFLALKFVLVLECSRSWSGAAAVGWETTQPRKSTATRHVFQMNIISYFARQFLCIDVLLLHALPHYGK